GAVRERVRHHFAARLPLQGIVADRAGGGQGLLDVAGFENVARLVGMKGPDAGEAVGLQFQSYRQRIALYLRGVLASLVNLVHDAEQVLHVMADFVRDHISLGEVAGSVESVFHQLIKREVDVDLLVAQTVERPARGLAGATSGRRTTGK